MTIINGTTGDDDDVTNPSLVGTIDDDVINGLAGDDSLLGGAGDDILSGDAGIDTLFGEGGNDTLYFESPSDLNDVYDGGANIDTFQIIDTGIFVDLTGITLSNLEIFDGGNELIHFNPGQLDAFTSMHTISILQHAMGGTSDFTNSIATGESGFFRGSTGNDHVIFTGADTGWDIEGNNGNDTLIGGEGADTITGGGHDDVILGGGGNDLIEGDGGNDNLSGQAGNDVIAILYSGSSVSPDADTIDGGVGMDTLSNQSFTALNIHGMSISNIEVLDAGGTVRANAGQLDLFASIERLSGVTHMTAGTTDLTGQVTSILGSSLTFNGSAGDDVFILTDAPGNVSAGRSDGHDTIITGSGDDTLSGGGGHNLLQSDAGDDSLDGGQGNDTLLGGAGMDTLIGREGDDLMRGGAGADQLFGVQGEDTADYSTSAGGVVIDLAAGTGVGGDAENDTLNSIEHVHHLLSSQSGA